MNPRDRESVQTTMILLNHPGHRDAQGQSITVMLGWGPDDPYAIRLGFSGGRVWMMDRELLAAGLTCPAGTGDVRLSPIGETHIDITFISHWSNEPTVTLRASRRTLQAFLDQVWSQRPDTINVTPVMDEWLRELTAT